MSIHQEVLDTVRRICRERRSWTFSPQEIVGALPHLSPSSVRTHIVSRCCVNAPQNHPHRWKYFKRVGRGVYEVLPAQRRGRSAARNSGRVSSGTAGRGRALQVAETARAFGRVPGAPRDTVHLVVTRERGVYVAECLELALVTQGHTLDEVVANVREAVGLHLEGERPALTGVVAKPRISLTYEITP